ncbi:ImmA/IrrE family metallo-endopeptidase [Intestinimonas sp.]|uniref:ImmA/IrrE family metallo-endopeptidase n=1 Tax=Intestinimonas sp. TaxID=1965293 RepID=UPI003AB71997
MTNLLELYEFAENHNIDVDWVPLTASKSLSMPFPDGSYGIAVDPWKMDTLEIETVLLSHELGHCMTGSFYNKYATCDVRRKHENRADKWAIQNLISEEELDDAVADGYADIWSLAEHFNVTEDFMRKAVCWYTHGNLATELYF